MKRHPDDLSRGGPTPSATRRGQPGVDDHGSDVFFAAIETTRMPMVLSDPNQPDDPIVFANRAFVLMTGYDRAEIVGRNCRFLQGPETDPGTVDLIRQAVRARSELSVELLNYRRDGTAFWNALFISPVFDPGGKLVYLFASQLDVSRRRIAEDALREARETAAVGQRAGAIAHDFNNLLQVITGHMDSLKDHAAASNDARLIRRVGAVSEAADRATALTRQLLADSRRQTGDGHLVERVPVAAQAGEVTRSQDSRPAQRGGGERILVVDDRAEVAELARTMLEGVGYAVEVATDGRDALERLQAGFDLLFSDLVMPGGLDGLSLAREAQRRHPKLRVLLTTGHADPAVDRTDAGGREYGTIAKPYRRADLARKVRTALDGPSGVS